MKNLLLGGVFAFCLVGCATMPKQAPTSLQIQAFQTKEFETSKSIVFGSVISVFQDLGYIVQSADKDTGFVTAASPASNKTSFLEAMGGVSSSGATKATAFVEEIRPGFVTVRLNFVDTKHFSGAYGRGGDQDSPILNPAPYQAAFEKIDTAIFIRQGNNAASP